MKQYSRVSYADRCQISAMLKSKISIPEIAKELGFNKSTIYREVKRNTGYISTSFYPGYFAQIAQAKTNERSKSRKKPLLLKGELKHWIESKIKDHWSPELIAGRYRIEKRKSLSYQTIYRHVGRNSHLKPYLKYVYKRGCGRQHQREIRSQTLLSIHQRPISANNRSRYGHWERDGMYGLNRNQLLVCQERKSRYVKLAIMETTKAEETNLLTQKLLKTEKVLSITNDNGTEFRRPETSNYPIYYCDPFSPNQRGSVENVIGTLRNKIKRSTDIKAFTDVDLNAIENWINKRPRKMFNYRTPYEVYLKQKVALVM